MQSAIQQARKSKSGKNLSVQIGGNWYTSKNWEFEQMVGQEITFEPTRQDFPDGGHIMWINEYGVTGGTTPADQAFNQAHAQAPPMGSPVPPGNLSQPAPMSQPAVQVGPNATGTNQKAPVDRDASITALALCKTVQPGEGIEDAWKRYVALYYKVLEWNPGSFDDSIHY